MGGDASLMVDAAAPAATGLFGAPAGTAEKKDAAPGQCAWTSYTYILSLHVCSCPGFRCSKAWRASKRCCRYLFDIAVQLQWANNLAAPAVAPPSMLRGKTVDEIVSRWTSELDTHVREFNAYAAEVAAWDRALIQNANNVGTRSVF
jgi:nuclear pore complex protein Nup62